MIQNLANDHVAIPVLEPRYHKAFTAGWNCYDLGGHAGTDCPWYSGKVHPWGRPYSKKAPAFERAWKAGYYAARLSERGSTAAQRVNSKCMCINADAVRTMGLITKDYDSDNIGLNGEFMSGLLALGGTWLDMNIDLAFSWAFGRSIKQRNPREKE